VLRRIKVEHFALTHARRLSEDEIREVPDYGIDMFLNFDSFIPE